MILDHYSQNRGRPSTFLVACPDTREAALIDPRPEFLDDCQKTLERRNLRLVRVLLTSPGNDKAAAVARLKEGREELEVHPQTPGKATHPAPGPCSTQSAGQPASIDVGKLRMTLEVDPRGPQFAGYRTGNFVFASDSLRVVRASQPGEGQALSGSNADHNPARISDPCGAARTADDDTSIEQLLLEDLHSSLMENAFSPKETLIIRSYIELLEENDSQHPSAAELAEKVGQIDRGVIHVLVHSIRWKQIDLGRLPLVLAGQASKWLRHLKTEPEFTPHEKEFLCAYLQLVSNTGAPPSGPEVAEKLGSHRSIQWVRKRAFTIRRKQREFNQPLLLLTRNRPEEGETDPHPSKRLPSREGYVANHSALS